MYLFAGYQVFQFDHTYFRFHLLPLRKIVIFDLISWCGNFTETFSPNCSKLCGNCAFSQNFHNGKLREIALFHVVSLLSNNFSVSLHFSFTFHFLSSFLIVEQLHVIYPELLKRMDDNVDENRLATTFAFTQYFK